MVISELLERRLELFPATTRLEDTGGGLSLSIGGCDLSDLAQRFGTPLYLYDRHTLDSAVASYHRALQRFYPAESGLTYAGKAFLCAALAEWAGESGLWVDCSSAGEIAIARAGGLARECIITHGVNKSPEDILAAVQFSSLIVVDNLSELERLAGLHQQRAHSFPAIWLRLNPGASVNTHTHIQTGGATSKFGMDADEALQAARFCLDTGLPLEGVHFHLGSQLREAQPVAEAMAYTLDVCTAMRKSLVWIPAALSPGGGWGVAYHEDDLPHPSIDEYVRTVAASLVEGCRQRELPLPRLQLEPGRSIIARAGVCLYRVGATKRAGERRWLLMDGGLADNPRPALYHARYSCLPVVRADRPISGPAWLGGPYCESGDVLSEAIPLPEIQVGELLAVPVSGAYQLSMSSNYNGALRPAVVWLDGGEAHLIQERETPADLTRRDRQLPRSGSTARSSPIQTKDP
jgi:diaminopimelate decarboxylase